VLKLDEKKYPKGLKVSDAQLATVTCFLMISWGMELHHSSEKEEPKKVTKLFF